MNSSDARRTLSRYFKSLDFGGEWLFVFFQKTKEVLINTEVSRNYINKAKVKV